MNVFKKALLIVALASAVLAISEVKTGYVDEEWLPAMKALIGKIYQDVKYPLLITGGIAGLAIVSSAIFFINRGKAAQSDIDTQ